MSRSNQTEMGLPGLIIRINPKQCDYARLEEKGDIFSSAANTRFAEHGAGRGTYLFAIASGPNKEHGILGVWRLTESPTREATAPQACYHQPYRQLRQQHQTRFRAECIYHVQQPNLPSLRHRFSSLLRRTTPVMLRSMQDVNALLQIAQLHR